MDKDPPSLETSKHPSLSRDALVEGSSGTRDAYARSHTCRMALSYSGPCRGRYTRDAYLGDSLVEWNEASLGDIVVHAATVVSGEEESVLRDMKSLS